MQRQRRGVRAKEFAQVLVLKERKRTKVGGWGR